MCCQLYLNINVDSFIVLLQVFMLSEQRGMDFFKSHQVCLCLYKSLKRSVICISIPIVVLDVSFIPVVYLKVHFPAKTIGPQPWKAYSSIQQNCFEISPLLAKVSQTAVRMKQKYWQQVGTNNGYDSKWVFLTYYLVAFLLQY